MESKKTYEEKPLLRRLKDFNLGHCPDTKEPPRGVNETAWGYPAIKDAVACANELVPGKEKFVCNAEADFGNQIVPVTITMVKRPDNPQVIYARANPMP